MQTFEKIKNFATDTTDTFQHFDFWLTLSKSLRYGRDHRWALPTNQGKHENQKQNTSPTDQGVNIHQMN